MMISLIIPFHNADRELFSLCMKSVFSQIYKDIEVIIINDGSDKQFLDVLEKAKNSDSRIRVINQECMGASGARNRGVLESKGEYIAFLDADDMIMPFYLNEALQLLKLYQSDLVVGGVRFVYRTEEMQSIFRVCEKDSDTNDIQIFGKDRINELKHHMASSRKLIKYDGGNIDRGPVARLVKREIAEKHPFREDLVIWEDMVWNLEILNNCRSVCVVKKTWYLYFQNPKSAIHRYRQGVVREAEQTMGYVEKLLNMETDEGYETFCDHVYDNLRRVCKLYFLRDECTLSMSERKKEYNRLYRNAPWALFGSDRYYHLTGGKYKIASFLFRKRVFFFVFGAKEKVKKIIGKMK